MTQSTDRHDHSAEALKAMTEAPRDAGEGSPDDFIGPEEAEVLEEGTIEPVEGVPQEGIAFAPDPAGASPGAAPPPLPGAIPAPDPLARRRRAESFDQRVRKAHAHQYKTIMIPLLITMGVLLLLMGAYALFHSAGETDVRVDAEGFPVRTVDPGPGAAFQKWFPFLAFPLGAILLVGAWWFHKDVNRKRT
jgi:hypothetical protein